MELELKHLAPYLPYELQIYFESLDGKDKSTWTLTYNEIDFLLRNKNKPILRPLSDLTKEIEVNGEKFVPCDILFNCGEFEKLLGHSSEIYAMDFINSVDRLSLCYDFNFWQKLFEWHFDIFGLIEKGLSVDINTLNKQS